MSTAGAAEEAAAARAAATVAEAGGGSDKVSPRSRAERSNALWSACVHGDLVVWCWAVVVIWPAGCLVWGIHAFCSRNKLKKTRSPLLPHTTTIENRSQAS
jgi:hypothetical protein